MAEKKRSVMVFLQNVFAFFIKFGNTEPTIRAVSCWVIVVIGSLVHDFHHPPRTYFSNKRNVFNVIFVKFALGWTLAAIAPFVILSSLMKSQGNVSVVLKNVTRLLVAFGVWYIVTSVFDSVLDFTGFCEGSELFSSRRDCVADGLLWKGFDVSGHSFLLAYCSLILSEEIQAYSFWSDENSWKGRVRFAQPLANFFYICSCLLILLWEVMLVFTAIYFHTVQSKVVGVITGLTSWALTYKVWFESKDFSPGLPTSVN